MQKKSKHLLCTALRRIPPLPVERQTLADQRASHEPDYLRGQFMRGAAMGWHNMEEPEVRGEFGAARHRGWKWGQQQRHGYEVCEISPVGRMGWDVAVGAARMIAEGAVELAREVGRAEGAYRGGIS